MLEFRNVTHVFGDQTRALHNISLSVPKGQFCVLLGPSGAGKSTLLNTVNGLVRPTSGDIVLDDQKVSRRNVREVQRRVGMIHQQLHLVPRLSVLHNVLSGLLPVTPNWRALLNIFPLSQQRRACRLLEEVDLEERHLYRRAAHLSGGQQQRVAIARAFIMAPDVVLADEPVASLDPAVSQHILRLIKQASSQRNTTVLCSLHQVEFATEFADRIVALRHGAIVYDGPPSELDTEQLEGIYGTDVRRGELYRSELEA